MKTRAITVLFIGLACCAASVQAADIIYLDLDAIDSWPGLTATQKTQFKNMLKADVQRNFDERLGAGKVTVTTTPTPSARRTVKVLNRYGSHRDKNGETKPHYGKWDHGSSTVYVYLKNFRGQNDRFHYKTGGQWDLTKLTNGIGRVIAHELAHSYSVGHNNNDGSACRKPKNKMTKKVSRAERANTTWHFDEHTGNVISGNLGKPPCQTCVDYSVGYLRPVVYDTVAYLDPDWDPNAPDPNDPNDVTVSRWLPLEDYGCFDAFLEITGPLAPMFDLGWYGRDTDGGYEDDNPDFDFIYKASAAELEPPDMLTFFDIHHAYPQFVLRGREGSPWEGLWYPMCDADIWLGDFVTNPDGDDIYRLVSLQWDIDGVPPADVQVDLDSFMVHPPEGGEFNGWQLNQAWPWPGDLSRDFDVDLSDLAELLAHYGQEWGAMQEEGDLDGDRDVDLSDLAALLSVYGEIYPGWTMWSDNFDEYAPGTYLHGVGDWKGWDNDPAFGAFVTDFQAFSPPLAVDVSGPTDLVHEYAGATSGAWAFTAWQYIPSDFVSGGGDIPGSFFIMLNTYVDGEPHEAPDYSVQMNFDSNDGMLKVYYGNGMNTVDVPYEPERWVELQVVIDLDADLTQVYYDGMFLVDYSWTGGVLGGGAGALNIAALDLYANDSSPIYYDDFSLTYVGP